jgi:hypothetical protein
MNRAFLSQTATTKMRATKTMLLMTMLLMTMVSILFHLPSFAVRRRIMQKRHVSIHAHQDRRLIAQNQKCHVIHSLHAVQMKSHYSLLTLLYPTPLLEVIAEQALRMPLIHARNPAVWILNVQIIKAVMVIPPVMTETPSIVAKLGMKPQQHAEKSAPLAKTRNVTMEMFALDTLPAMIRVHSFAGHPLTMHQLPAQHLAALLPIVRLAKHVSPLQPAILQKQTCQLSHFIAAQRLRMHPCRVRLHAQVGSIPTAPIPNFAIPTRHVLSAIRTSVV